MSMRASAIAAAGIVLSQPTRQTRPSRWCERVASSIESAMTSRLTSEPRMPSTPIVTPSETEIVLNSIGVPPASRMPFLTFCASARWLKLHGIVSIHVVATPTNGRARSSSVKPIALSIARAAARSGPSVMTAELRLAGSDGRSYGFSDMPPILGGSPRGASYFGGGRPAAARRRSTLAFALARGRHGLGFTFTRLPLTRWYLAFGFLSGQSFLRLTAAFAAAGFAAGVAGAAAAAARRWPASTGQPLPVTLNTAPAPPLPPGAATSGGAGPGRDGAARLRTRPGRRDAREERAQREIRHRARARLARSTRRPRTTPRPARPRAGRCGGRRRYRRQRRRSRRGRRPAEGPEMRCSAELVSWVAEPACPAITTTSPA